MCWGAADVKAAFDDSLAQDGDARADRKTKMNWMSSGILSDPFEVVKVLD